MNSEPEVQALRALMYDKAQVQAFNDRYIETVLSLGSEASRDQERLREVRRLMLDQLVWLRDEAGREKEKQNEI